MELATKGESKHLQSQKPSETVINSASSADNTSDIQQSNEFIIPWRYNWVAFVCVVALPLGTNWADASLGPLKDTLRQELGITNSQYGVISNADSFINSIVPILGGLILDWWGPNIVTLCCTVVLFIGSVISAVGVQISVWRVLAGGHILMGIGITVLDSATQKMVYHWFGARDFGFVFVVAGMTAVPTRDNTGWYGWSFWVPVLFCFSSLIMNIFYFFFVRYIVPKEYKPSSGRQSAVSKEKYLMLPATQVLQSGTNKGYNGNAADIVQMRGYTDEVSGYLSTGQRVMRILINPAIGYLIDRWGHRFHYIAAAPLLWIIAFALLGFTSAHPLIAPVFSGIAGGIQAMPLQICFPLLLGDQHKLGTAFGLWRAFNNAGNTIMGVSYGLLQDRTPKLSFERVLSLAIGLKSWAFVLALAYIFIDHKCMSKTLTLTRKRREAKEEMIEDKDEDPLTRRTTKTWTTVVILALLTALIATAWALFIVFII